jgi:transcriptional regulator with XRE-family HTH domain
MNLQKMIAELTAAGVTQHEIAKAMDCTQATVSRYASGEIESCNYESGKALVELHHAPGPAEADSSRPRSRKACCVMRTLFFSPRVVVSIGVNTR